MHHKNKLRFLSILATAPLVALPITTCSCSSYSPDTNWTPVHEFINERIFSVADVNRSTGSAVFGTLWLFYHDTYATNNYTYYAITNNHVTSGFNSLQANGTMSDLFGIYLGYQDAKSASSTNKQIPFSSISGKKTGEENQYSLIDQTQQRSLSGYTKFKPVFTTYIQSGGYNYYRDMTIVKVDLNDYKNTDLAKNRLDDLNAYGNQHDNMLVEFDDYTNTSKSTIYVGGYPVNYMDEHQGSIYNNAVKFQSMTFTSCEADIFSSLDAFINYAYNQRSASQESVYNALNTKDNFGSLCSADWNGPHVTNKKTPFGGGASGSMAIRATDINNPDTYKVTGIYWGGMSAEDSNWYFEPHFTPFVFNFGKNLPSGYTWDIIKAFDPASLTSSNPINYCMYP